MIIAPSIRAFIAAIAFTLTFSGQAYALTVYDVIKLSKKNYSSQDIVALIEVTDSAFTLKAEDIPRLKDLGVSETVIQAMLKATHSESQSESPTDSVQLESNSLVSSNHNDTADDHIDSSHKNAKQVETVPMYAASNNTITQKGFSAESFEETAVGGRRSSPQYHYPIRDATVRAP